MTYPVQVPQATTTFKTPTRSEYKVALLEIEPYISKEQRKMLGAHFNSHGVTTTATHLAAAAPYSSYVEANNYYGKLGRMLGEALGKKFEFVEYVEGGGQNTLLRSAISIASHYGEPGTGHNQLVMHHELWLALKELGWFSTPDSQGR